MLPSTGYFKAIACPFYDSGSCERPYCHFKHVRRDDTSNPAPLILGSNIINGADKNAYSTEGREQKNETTSTTSSERPNSEIIEQLVNDAVSKALADEGVVNTESVSKNIVSKVVEGLKPKLNSSGGKHSGVPQFITKPPCVYNPTPISELRKRHIAVPVYNPTRESGVAVKRKSTEDSTKPWLSALPDSIRNDYGKKSHEVTYKPTTIVHESVNYVPTAKLDDGNSSDYSKRNEDLYYPKSKKRREEYVPKNVKVLPKKIDQLDEIRLDSVNSEFNLLDDITISQSKDDTNSQDYYNIEGKFSDDETIELSNREVQREEVENITEICNTESHSVNSSESAEAQPTGKDEKIISESAEGHSSSDKKDHVKRRSSSTDRNNKRDSHHSNDKHSKDSKKHSTSRREEHRGSSSKRRSSSSGNSSSKHKSHHREKSSSSHRHSSNSNNNNDKSQRSSSHRRKSDSKENHDHKSSRHRNREKSSSSKKSSKHSHDEKKTRIPEDSSKSSDKKSSDDESDKDKYSSMNFDELLETSDSEHDVEEECLKIFQEYQVSDSQNTINHKEQQQERSATEEKAEDVGGKKRVAHPSAATSIRSTGLPSQSAKKFNPSPQQRMYERWRLMREAAGAKSTTEDSTKTKIEITNNNVVGEKPVNGNTSSRTKRIAHVPYAMSLAMSKKAVAEATAKPVEPKTVAQTSTKGTARVAHIPQKIPNLVRPEPLHVATQKFPLNVRQYYVNMMQDICIQIYTCGEDAAQRALREEFSCHERCKALTVYKNSCMLAAHRLRKEIDQTEVGPSATMGLVSHDAVLAGKSKGSWSVVKVKKAETNFKDAALYCMLKKWIMIEQQLKDNGFPRIHPDGPKGRAKIYAIRNQPQISKVPNQRICCRCGQAYMVDKRGLAVQDQNCIYHWGRKFTVRGEGKYSCCQQYGSAGGCSDAKNHVWDFIDYDNLRGYVTTLPKDIPPEEQGVYALDCEMCYTTQGLELTRLTVINQDCNVIYETLVKPENPIIDYNTRFSGITEKDMLGITTTLLDVQATLLTMFSEHTILVGHSLESDFKALKLIHNTVVDTSMVFPHKNGFPHKRALKNLCSEYLRKIIQNDVGGHDSNEDAVACMELIHWKVREEAKLQ